MLAPHARLVKWSGLYSRDGNCETFRWDIEVCWFSAERDAITLSNRHYVCCDRWASITWCGPSNCSTAVTECISRFDLEWVVSLIGLIHCHGEVLELLFSLCHVDVGDFLSLRRKDVYTFTPFSLCLQDHRLLDIEGRLDIFISRLNAEMPHSAASF